MYIKKTRVYANDEIENEVMDEGVEGGDVEVAPEASDLLFETEDVANLLAEVTAEDVEVEIADDGDSVAFEIGNEIYTVEAEGDEELVESATSLKKRPSGKKVTANRKVVANKRTPVARKASAKRPVKASKQTRRSVRRVHR